LEGRVILIDNEDNAKLEYALSVNNDPVGYIRHGKQMLHRWILGLEVGDPRIGDHINGDVLDNRRDNLRIVTPTQSNYNRRSWKKDGLPRGVTRSTSGRFYARLKHEGVSRHLGTYDTPEEASGVYQEALRKITGAR
jgi:hypothetical protein